MTCALELCYVASGRIDAVIKHNQAFYDYIGGALILTEALENSHGLATIDGLNPVLPYTTLGSRVGLLGTNGLILDELRYAISDEDG